MTLFETLPIVAAGLASATAIALAAYERGHHNGRRAELCDQQTADELALLNGSRGRHPSRCQEC